jgi:hypothetical protein
MNISGAKNKRDRANIALNRRTNSVKWFKMWCEARNDAKLRSLSDAEHRLWFQLLCLAGEQDPPGVITMIPRLLKIEVGSFNETNDSFNDSLISLNSLALVNASFDDSGNVTIVFPAYEKRQRKYPSDSPERVKARVAKHFKNKRLGNKKSLNESLESLNESLNESLTSQNDRLQITEEREEFPLLSPLLKATEEEKSAEKAPSVKTILLPDWLPREEWAEFVAMRKSMRNVPFGPAAVKRNLDDLARLREQGYDPAVVLRQSVARGYRGVCPVNNDRQHGHQDKPRPKPEPTRYLPQAQPGDIFWENAKRMREIWTNPSPPKPSQPERRPMKIDPSRIVSYDDGPDDSANGIQTDDDTLRSRPAGEGVRTEPDSAASERQ